MRRRKLGSTGIEVSPLALGGNVFGWTVDEATGFKILDGFVSAGFNFIDTADTYAGWIPGNVGGESETIIGNWFKQSGRRDEVVVATKVGGKIGRGRPGGLSKAYIQAAVEDSLRRLQTDYIDLYQSHYDDPNIALKETLEAYGSLVEQKKIRAIGASNYTAERLTEALETGGRNGLRSYQTLQPLYNLYDRTEYETKLEPICVQHGLGVLSYYALASGFLTGKYRSERDFGKSLRGAGARKYLNPRGYRILSALDEVAQRLDSSPAQVALAWLCARPSVTAPIVSVTSLEQLNEVVGAPELNLDATAKDRLDRASAGTA
jgi:aryl-alcohol dehydrogenase-like predicted oxidoreductase